ncbi:MAG TPA: T9SS type A sorting domain-containing protein [Chitinophagales bacterium]|nr:T9SS type A sorting domain-containing protein [Chitinophagales bacterium]
MKLFLCTLSLIWSCIAFGQNPQWVNFFTGNSIYDIEETDSSYWVGTETRLVKISKQSGQTSFFTPSNQRPFYTYDIAAFSDDSVWLTTNNLNTIHRYIFNGSLWDEVTAPAYPSPLDEMANLKIDHQNVLWGSGGDSLYSYDGNALKKFFPALQIYALYDFVIDTSNTFWVHTGIGLMKFKDSTFELVDTTGSGMGGDAIVSITLDPQQNVWLGMKHTEDSTYWDGYYWVNIYTYSFYVEKFDGSNWTSFHPTQDYGWGIRNITSDLNGTIWFSTGDSGIVKLEGNIFTVVHPDNPNLVFSSVFKIFVDKNNIKLFCTTDGGLLRFDGQNWTRIKTANCDLPGNIVNAIGADKNGKIWTHSWQYPAFASAGLSALSSFDGTSWQSLNGDFNNSQNWILDRFNFANDHEGNMWIFGDTIMKYDGTNWISSGIPPLTSPTSITVDKNDQVWVTSSGGLLKVTQDFQSTEYNDGNSGLQIYSPYGLCADSSGNVWIGYQSLERFDGNSDWQLFFCEDYNWGCGGFTKLLCDHNNTIWADHDGVKKYDGISFQSFNTQNSELPDDYITCMAVDLLNNLWIGSGGLTKFDGNTFTVYDPDSFPMLNWPISIYVDSHGNKWMGSNGGITVFNETGVVLGIDEPDYISGKPGADVYPNPASDIVSVFLKNPVSGKVKLQLHDCFGRVLKTEIHDSSHQINLSIKSLPDGFYILSILEGEMSVSRSIVKVSQ